MVYQVPQSCESSSWSPRMWGAVRICPAPRWGRTESWRSCTSPPAPSLVSPCTSSAPAPPHSSDKGRSNTKPKPELGPVVCISGWEQPTSCWAAGPSAPPPWWSSPGPGCVLGPTLQQRRRGIFFTRNQNDLNITQFRLQLSSLPDCRLPLSSLSSSRAVSCPASNLALTTSSYSSII